MSDLSTHYLNIVAEIYGRPLLTPPAMDVYRRLVDIKDDVEFVRKLGQLAKTLHRFPLPADFNQELVQQRQDTGPGTGMD